MDRVLGLSNRLRQEGVDCRIDQYETSPPEGWPHWIQRQVEEADFVLTVCTENYLRQISRREESGKGRGALWEGAIISQELYSKQNKKFVPIVFSGEASTYIPLFLRGATYFHVANDLGYEQLYRFLTNQPAIGKPNLGSLRVLPPRERGARQDFRLWNVPYPRNPLFTGREKVLQGLHTALKRRGAAALSGRAGVGKTQTAIEYAWRHRQEYASVLWSRAESREALISGFGALATQLGILGGQATDQEIGIAAVKGWLEATEEWLLILDGADDIAMTLEAIPGGGKGHILITTRAHGIGAIAERVDIGAMDPDDGALFLLRRTGLIAKDQQVSGGSAADRKVAEQISNELGGLPLALDQAGAFIEETHSTLAEYLAFYRSEVIKLLSDRPGLGQHPSVPATLSVAFQRLASENAVAADVIRLCAFLAPDAIPEEIFTQGPAEHGERLGLMVAGPIGFEQVLTEAGRFSLLVRDLQNKTLHMHRIVQAMVRDRMGQVEQRQWAERAVRAVNHAFPSLDPSNWPACERLLPHALRSAELIRGMNFEFQEAGRLLFQTASYLWVRARYGEAERLYQLALSILEMALGPFHPGVAQSLNNLAGLYGSQGKFVEAEPLYRRAMAIRERALGPDHADVAASLDNLAGLLRSQGKYAEAEPLYRRAMAIRERALGPDHADVAASLDNLAGLLRSQGKYAEAEPLYRRAMAIREQALGPEHPEVGNSLNNLAEIYRAQGSYAEAEPLYKRALYVNEKALGPEHPNVADSLNNLAVHYTSEGKLAEAEPLFRRALAILEGSLGPDHPKVSTVLRNYAYLMAATSRLDEAAMLDARIEGIRMRRKSQL
jgi:tetratricopeptide (TPR) repeat protein